MFCLRYRIRASFSVCDMDFNRREINRKFIYFHSCSKTLKNNLQLKCQISFHLIFFHWRFSKCDSKHQSNLKCDKKWYFRMIRLSSTCVCACVTCNSLHQNAINWILKLFTILFWLFIAFFPSHLFEMIYPLAISLRKTFLFVCYSIWSWTRHFCLFCLFQSNHFAYKIHIFSIFKWFLSIFACYFSCIFRKCEQKHQL